MKNILARARALYANGSDDNIEIDDHALVSKCDNGVWVQAWVWVPDEQPGNPDERSEE